MPQTRLRTLSIYDKGSTYTIFDTNDKTQLFTIRFNSRSVPHMTLIRALDAKSIVGSVTYEATKKFDVSSVSSITFKFPLLRHRLPEQRRGLLQQRQAYFAERGSETGLLE